MAIFSPLLVWQSLKTTFLYSAMLVKNTQYCQKIKRLQENNLGVFLLRNFIKVLVFTNNQFSRVILYANTIKRNNINTIYQVFTFIQATTILLTPFLAVTICWLTFLPVLTSRMLNYYSVLALV